MTTPTEDLMTFPCDFPLKVFGKKSDAFEVAVLSIIKKHVQQLKENAVRTRESKDGNYLAMTVTFEAESKAQLDALYSDLTACDEVVTAL